MFEAVDGRPPPTISRYSANSSSNAAVDQELCQRDIILQQLMLTWKGLKTE